MTKKGNGNRKDVAEVRIRAVLGVTGEGPMPRIRPKYLRKYHAHLAANFSFPFAGRLADPIGPHRDTRTPLSVVRLMDPVEEYEPEEMYGLICEAVQNGEGIELPLDRIDMPGDDPNCQMLEDYRWWMQNWG